MNKIKRNHHNKVYRKNVILEVFSLANRPRLGDLQKGQNSLKGDFRDFKNEFKDFKNEVRNKFKEVDRREVIRLLQEKNSPYSDKFRYTYEEIGNIVGISTTEVNNIAKEEGLSRRGSSQGA